MKAIVYVGIPASGKSEEAAYLVNEKDWVELNRDDVRFEIHNDGVRDWTKYKFSKKNEDEVSERIDLLLDQSASLKENIVCSDTNLNPVYREAMLKKLEDYGYDVQVKVCHVTLEEAWKRDANRQGGVGKDVIYSMYRKYLKYVNRKVYVPDESKQDCIIVDIDGTVAEMHNRKPYEWGKVGQDLPRTIIIDMVMNMAHEQNMEVIFLSGRDSSCRKETEDWLNTYIITMDTWEEDLFMRAEGDMRKDTIIKEELFWEHIAPNYNVKMVVDDRPCMIRLWHELEIPNVISVADPFKEF